MRLARSSRHDALGVPAAWMQPLPDPLRSAESQGSGGIALAPTVGPADSRGSRLAEGDPAEEILRLAEPLRATWS